MITFDQRMLGTDQYLHIIGLSHSGFMFELTDLHVRIYIYIYI